MKIYKETILGKLRQWFYKWFDRQVEKSFQRKANKQFRTSSKTKLARSLKQKNDSPRSGTHRVVVKKYLQKLGWQWTPTMFIGQGCKVHLKKDELPSGTLIVSCSKHITVVKDGVLYDTHDCSRNGTRCVYGYWTKPN